MTRTVFLCVALLGCSAHHGATSDVDAAVQPSGDAGGDARVDGSTTGGAITTVFVIPFENKANGQIYGNTTDAPYINGLLATAAHATGFGDELPSLPSEPHYVFMEGGTNTFSDRTFTSDSDPSMTNSTASTEHLVTSLAAAGIAWRSYQEDITTGTCPIATDGVYAPKHDPFVFFRDVVGTPPSATAPICAAHHKAYADFAADLAGGLSGYIFITPNLCHDMHGDIRCPSGLTTAKNIAAGDAWLAAELPRIIAYTQAHAEAVIFLTWDEGNATNVVPFIAIGQHVAHGVTSTTTYTHGSIIASVQALFGVPKLPAVATAHVFADMFEPGLLQQ